MARHNVTAARSGLPRGKLPKARKARGEVSDRPIPKPTAPFARRGGDIPVDGVNAK